VYQPSRTHAQDQWGLLLVTVVCDQAITAKDWVDAFVATNLHPNINVPMVQWLEKIKDALTASEAIGTNREVSVTDILPDIMPIWYS
jgi:hypothetical protein